MMIARKMLLTIGALFVGPVMVVLIEQFHSWSLSGGLFTMVLVSGTAVHSVWRTPKKEKEEIPNRSETTNRSWEFVRQCWIGEQQLWKIFWIVGLGVSVVLSGVSYLSTEYNAPIIWWVTLVVLAAPVQVWWVVSVWRCAKNTGKKIWTVLSRSFAVISGVYVFYAYFLLVAYSLGIL